MNTIADQRYSVHPYLSSISVIGRGFLLRKASTVCTLAVMFEDIISDRLNGLLTECYGSIDTDFL